MSRDDLHFRLRIPEELKARVETAARQNKRSMTAEIIHALEQAYPAPTPLPPEFEALQSTLQRLVVLETDPLIRMRSQRILKLIESYDGKSPSEFERLIAELKQMQANPLQWKAL